MWGLRAACTLLLCALSASQTCPNSCSKHGYCDTLSTKTCKCFEGWTGHDCGLRSCPTGPAWVAPARPGEYGRPHERDAECSGAGDCDRTTGRCTCQAPFTGGACQKLDCPLGCSGAGTCVSLREAGLRPEWLRRPHTPTRYNEWDADTIFGCACNEWASGFACEDAACPTGDDPVTPGAPEVQAITCACPGGCSGGSFAVSLGQGREVTILASAVATAAQESSSALVNSGAAVGESVASRLAGLWGLPAVSTVTFSGAAATACSTPGETTITVTLLKRMGDASSLSARAGTLVDATGREAAATAATVTQGTTESVPCSGRGTCDRYTGLCECNSGFFSSDGNGGPGGIPNCGSQTDPYTAVTTALTQCPDPACSKHGVCSGSPTFICKCFPGWTGSTCGLMTCPLGPAWFSAPTGATTPHGLELCSGAGRCDDATGRCVCYEGFSGIACQRLMCPSLLASVVCSGHGKCASLREMTDAATANGIPYGVNEVQSIKCSLTVGTFVLYSGTHGTLPIATSATPAALQAALEALPFVSLLTVRVHPYSATSICSASGTTTTVTFTSNTGNQPPLEPALSGGAVGTVTVTETVQGTRRAYGNDRGMVGGPEWDADAIAGCMCDRYGYVNATNARDGDGAAYSGVSCTQRTCPFGQLPNVPAGAVPPNVQEVQRLSCSASSGSFTLSFRQSTTGPILAGASAEAVVAALQGLPSVGLVSLTKVAGWATGSAVCNPFGEAAVSDITFVTELGDVPLLVADGYLLDAPGAVTAVEQVKGIGLLLECSGKGKCNRVTGVCLCDKGWFSSDGLGGLGQRGDCGSFSTESFGYFK